MIGISGMSGFKKSAVQLILGPFFAKGEQNEVTIPHEIEDFEPLFDEFKKFEGFNYETFIEAMSSTEHAKIG